jgi:hypothetical protein
MHTGRELPRFSRAKLSEVKVRPQYRALVRYRLMVLEYAWTHGPAALGTARASSDAEALALGIVGRT